MRPITPTMPPAPQGAGRGHRRARAALVLHWRRATLKATNVLAMLAWLGIKPSYWPRVSDDNPDAETPFRVAKYRPGFPAKGFPDTSLPGAGR
jgi:hypothetical protein